MKIAHICLKRYHKGVPTYEGSIAHMIGEFVHGQRNEGHQVDLLSEYDFSKNDHPDYSDLFPDKLKEYDVIICHEATWLPFLERMGIKNYVHFMHGGSTLGFKNHISPTNYYNVRQGGRAKVIPMGLNPDRFVFNPNKDDREYFLHINAWVKKKGLIEIVDRVRDERMEIYGASVCDTEYNKKILEICRKKPNINVNMKWIYSEDKYDVLPKAKAVLLAHLEKFGPESCVLGQLEAMHSGTPVVALGAIFQEVSQHNVTGLIAQNWSQFRSFMDRVCDNIDPVEVRKWAIENRNAKDMNIQHLELYEFVANGGQWG